MHSEGGKNLRKCKKHCQEQKVHSIVHKNTHFIPFISLNRLNDNIWQLLSFAYHSHSINICFTFSSKPIPNCIHIRCMFSIHLYVLTFGGVALPNFHCKTIHSLPISLFYTNSESLSSPFTIATSPNLLLLHVCQSESSIPTQSTVTAIISHWNIYYTHSLLQAFLVIILHNISIQQIVQSISSPTRIPHSCSSHLHC